MSQTSQAYLIIKSEDRNKKLYPSPSNFAINATENQFVNTRVISFEPESFEMWYNVPNINSRNNSFVLDDGSTSYPITVQEGYYNYVQLAAEIQIQIDLALGAGTTFEWDVNAARFTISGPTPLKFTKYEPQSRDLANVCGFAYDQPLSNAIVGGSADLEYTRNIYVVSRSLHRSKRAQDQSSNGFLSDILFVVPVNGYSLNPRRANPIEPAGYSDLYQPKSIYFQPQVGKRIKFNPDESISNIDVQLLDDQNESLYNPFSDNPDFSYSWRMTVMANHL